MTRKRTRPAVDLNDGGAFRRENRPPDALLPKEFREALAEIDTLGERLSEASKALAEMGGPHGTGKWPHLEAAAREADAKASAVAAREGRKIENLTANLDALRRRRDEAMATIGALNGAVSLVMGDLATIREGAKANLSAHDKAIAAARAQLRRATAEVATAAKAVATAIAVREWLVDHAPFDDTVELDAAAVVHGLDAALGGAGRSVQPVRLDTILDAINDL